MSRAAAAVSPHPFWRIKKVIQQNGCAFPGPAPGTPGVPPRGWFGGTPGVRVSAPGRAARSLVRSKHKPEKEIGKAIYMWHLSKI